MVIIWVAVKSGDCGSELSTPQVIVSRQSFICFYYFTFLPFAMITRITSYFDIPYL